MGKMGKFDCKGIKELQKQLENLQEKQGEFLESCAKELAARLLAKVIRRTPVGDYSKEITVVAKRDGKKHKKGEEYKKKVNPSGKKGGTLRKGWAAGEIRKEGSVYKVEISNNVEYAPYVEYGHRTPSHKGWVPGKFMLTISEQELETIAPKVLENRIKEFMEGCLK